MKDRFLSASIGFQWRSWVQIFSVAFVDLQSRFVASLLITGISLLLTSWIIVPVSVPLFAVDTQLFLVIPGIWILVMSHLSFTEKIHRPLHFAISLPVPVWKWWLARVIVTFLIHAAVAGMIVLAAIVWIRLAGDPAKIDSNLSRSIYYIFLTTCSMAAAFLIWSSTGFGYLWLVCLMVLASRLYSDSNGVIFGIQFFPHLAILLPVGLFLSYLSFIRQLRGKRTNTRRANRNRITAGRYFPWAVRAASVAACIISLAVVSRTNRERASIIQTEHLEFSCDKKDLPVLQPLIDSADDHYKAVQKIFDPVKHEPRSRVVITSEFDQTGTVGVANWNMVRLGRDALGMAEKFPTEEVLRHELAHVFLETLSDGKLKRHFQAMQIFHEGVATWCESLPDREGLTPMQTHRVLQTLANERWGKPVSFSDMLNGKGNAYGHGFLLAEALAGEYGVESFRRIASEVATLESKSIFYRGEAFWYLLCNRLGYSVELLETAYLKVKSDFEDEYAEILSLPEPEFTFTWLDGEVILRPEHIPGELANPVFYTKTEKDTNLREFGDPLTADNEGNIRISFEELKSIPRSDSGRIQYRAGWKIESLPLPLYYKTGQFPWNYRLEENHRNFVKNTLLVRSSSDHAKDRGGAQAIDGSSATYWHTRRGKKEDTHPHELVIDLRKSVEIKAIHYLVRQDTINSWDGSFEDCEFLVSDDPGSFSSVAAKATFGKSRQLQTVECRPTVKGRYVLVRILSEVNGKPWASAAEIIVEHTGQ
ncbi:MAG: discoidin domain-containing protein [Verrucomicrobiales bacterium]|nr:discoidin domain-containing protein [Verrucomicrobiales bacterium]